MICCSPSLRELKRRQCRAPFPTFVPSSKPDDDTTQVAKVSTIYLNKQIVTGGRRANIGGRSIAFHIRKRGVLRAVWGASAVSGNAPQHGPNCSSSGDAVSS